MWSVRCNNFRLCSLTTFVQLGKSQTCPLPSSDQPIFKMNERRQREQRFGHHRTRPRGEPEHYVRRALISNISQRVVSAAHAETASPNRASLMGLPLEPRNHIYELVLGGREEINLTVDHHIFGKMGKGKLELLLNRSFWHPALTRVSKLVRKESIYILYRCKTIRCHTTQPLTTLFVPLLRKIGTPNRKLLRGFWVFCSKRRGSCVHALADIGVECNKYDMAVKTKEFVPSMPSYQGYARFSFN